MDAPHTTADRFLASDPGLAGWVRELRRAFHRYPEPGFAETRTQAKVCETLAALGIEHRKAARTGVVGEIRGTRPGACLALRADMDALAVTEAETVLNREYRSRNDGMMHACGHDAHLAMLLGAAKLLQAHRGELAGRVRLLFQPSEENLPGGARELVAEGALDDVAAVLGLHVLGLDPPGELRFRAGPFMAHACDFRLAVTGRAGHHMNPQNNIDPIAIAARFVDTLPADLKNSIDPEESWVLGFGSIHSGSQFNQTPEQAQVTGSYRAFNYAVADEIENTMRRRLDGLMQEFRKLADPALPRYELTVVHGYPVLKNDHRFCRRAAATLRQAGVPVDDETRRNLGGEDFACYLEKVPGMFAFLTAGNRARGITAFNHSPRFDIDEEVLVTGVRVLLTVALDFLSDPTAYAGD